MVIMSKEQRRSDSFVVRIWWERGDGAQSVWRGWAQHAASGKQHYFADVAQLLAFIEAHTGSLSHAPARNADKRRGQSQ